MAASTRRTRRPDRSADERGISDLVSVGPATIGDLRLLGITQVAQLRRCRAETLYRRLCTLTKARHDPCCQDVFAAAIAQAKDPRLPARQRNWWYWSRVRKAASGCRSD